MAGTTIDTLGTLMTKYMPGATETLNNEIYFRKRANKSYRWEGDHIEFNLHTARNHGIGYIEDAGALPVADKEDHVWCKAYRRNLAGSVQVSDGALATAATTKNAARDTATSSLKGLVEGMAKLENFMGYGVGDGSVSKLGTDITAAAAGDVFGATDARMLWDGQTYEIRDAADITVLHGTMKVTSTARALDANGDFAVTAGNAMPAGVAAGDYIVWPNSVNRAISGLGKLIDDTTSGTFQGLTMAGYPRYTSPVLDNSGDLRPQSPTLFRQMLAMIRQESGMKKGAIDVLTTFWQSIETEELFEPELRITPDTKVGGATIAAFQSTLGRVNIRPDVDATYNTMFFVDWNTIFRAVQKELDWRRDGKNGPIFKRSDQSTVYRATALEICEYFIKGRNSNGKIKDLSETVTSAY